MLLVLLLHALNTLLLLSGKIGIDNHQTLINRVGVDDELLCAGLHIIHEDRRVEVVELAFINSGLVVFLLFVLLVHMLHVGLSVDVVL